MKLSKAGAELISLVSSRDESTHLGRLDRARSILMPVASARKDRRQQASGGQTQLDNDKTVELFRFAHCTIRF